MNRGKPVLLRAAVHDRDAQAVRLRVVIHNKGQAEVERINVAVVDDDPNDRLLLQRALNRSDEFCCVGCYPGGQQALDEIPVTGAQAVLMDVRMPGLCGISCTKQLKLVLPALTIIVVTVLPELDTLKEALLAGADGFLNKPVSDLECREAIHYALAGGLPLARTFGGKLSALLAKQGFSHRSSPDLNARESAVMDCVSDGLRNKEIADKLGVSIHVVGKLTKRIYAKLRVSNRRAVSSHLHSH